jgi:hypothetical protein
MAQHSELDRANSQHALPDLDVLYIARSMALQYGRVDWYCKPGWYRYRPSASGAAGWVTSGPFETEAEARQINVVSRRDGEPGQDKAA